MFEFQSALIVHIILMKVLKTSKGKKLDRFAQHALLIMDSFFMNSIEILNHFIKEPGKGNGNLMNSKQNLPTGVKMHTMWCHVYANEGKMEYQDKVCSPNCTSVAKNYVMQSVFNNYLLFLISH